MLNRLKDEVFINSSHEGKSLAGDRKMRFHKLLFTLYHRMKISYLNSLVDSRVKIYDRIYSTWLFCVPHTTFLSLSVSCGTIQYLIQHGLDEVDLFKEAGRQMQESRYQIKYGIKLLSSYGLEIAQRDLQ